VAAPVFSLRGENALKRIAELIPPLDRRVEPVRLFVLLGWVGVLGRGWLLADLLRESLRVSWRGGGTFGDWTALLVLRRLSRIHTGDPLGRPPSPDSGRSTMPREVYVCMAAEPRRSVYERFEKSIGRRLRLAVPCQTTTRIEGEYGQRVRVRGRKEPIRELVVWGPSRCVLGGVDRRSLWAFRCLHWARQRPGRSAV